MKNQRLVGKVFVIVDNTSASPVCVTNKIAILHKFVKESGLTVSATRRSVDGEKAISDQLVEDGFVNIYNPDYKAESGVDWFAVYTIFPMVMEKKVKKG